MALLEKAAGQGHAYAMAKLGHIHRVREEYEQTAEWFTKGAEAGLPEAMYNLAVLLDTGMGAAAPDHPAAATWYAQAAGTGHMHAAYNLSKAYTSARGVTRSKRRAMQWCRKAADLGNVEACLQLAEDLYADQPYAREIGHAGEAAGVATSIMAGHDVPPDVLAGVVHWLRKMGMGQPGIGAKLDALRKEALEGGQYCFNEGCEVVGHLKDFKVCPQCKTHRYCGDACQKQDWTTGGHKSACGKTFQFYAPE